VQAAAARVDKSALIFGSAHFEGRQSREAWAFSARYDPNVNYSGTKAARPQMVKKHQSVEALLFFCCLQLDHTV
jgi:hypothetical protein